MLLVSDVLPNSCLSRLSVIYTASLADLSLKSACACELPGKKADGCPDPPCVSSLLHPAHSTRLGKGIEAKDAMVLVLQVDWTICLQDDCQTEMYELSSWNDRMPQKHQETSRARDKNTPMLREMAAGASLVHKSVSSRRLHQSSLVSCAGACMPKPMLKSPAAVSGLLAAFQSSLTEAASFS